MLKSATFSSTTHTAGTPVSLTVNVPVTIRDGIATVAQRPGRFNFTRAMLRERMVPHVGCSSISVL